MLTVIICTYNRARYIKPLLESIVANDLPASEYEILVVDNNCTDNTQAVCHSFATAHPQIKFRIIEEKEQGLSAARNCGIREAKGDQIVYIDDDALVDTNYLREYVDYFAAHTDVMALGGPIIPLYETIEPDWMTPYTRALLTAWMDYGDKPREYPKDRFPGGGNAAYRKIVFDHVGLFNTELGRKGNLLLASEEKDIFDKMHALGMKVMYIPGPVLHHSIPQSKLEKDYFDRVTYNLGVSNRYQTLAISKSKYVKQLLKELIKWCGAIVLAIGYTLQARPTAGWKLLEFRYNVTKGLIDL